MQSDLNTDAEEFYGLLKRLRQTGVDASPPLSAQLSPALLTLLERLSDHPNSTIVELAQSLERAVSTMSIEVRRLEDLGLVERRRHPSDGRSVLLHITPAGQDLVSALRDTRCRTMTRLLSGLESEERQTLLALLNKAISAIEESGAPIEKRSLP